MTPRRSQPLLGVTAYVLPRRKSYAPVTVRGKRYVVVEVPPERFFGFTQLTVLGEPIQMATIERALLDALDRPARRRAREVSRIVYRAASRVC